MDIINQKREKNVNLCLVPFENAGERRYEITLFTLELAHPVLSRHVKLEAGCNLGGEVTELTFA